MPDTEYHAVTTEAYTSGATSEDLKTAVTVENDRYAQLTVTKVTSFDQTGSETALFSGVSFQLYKAADGNAQDFDPEHDTPVGSSVKTGADGTATWTKLEPGTYWLRETLPEGYTEVGGETTQYKYTKVVLKAGAGQGEGYDPSSATITNTATHGKIQIGKTRFSLLRRRGNQFRHRRRSRTERSLSGGRGGGLRFFLRLFRFPRGLPRVCLFHPPRGPFPQKSAEAGIS